MITFSRGAYVARLAETPADIEAAQRLRHQSFIAGRGAVVEGVRAEGLDADQFDATCEHMLIEERRSGRLVCCYRMLPLGSGAEIGRSYSALHYDLCGLCAYPSPMMEMGRFCVHPDWRADPNVIRTAWTAMATHVEARRVEMLFGCSSFDGVEAEVYMDAFALLKARHLAPKRWLPRIKAPKIFPFARLLRRRRPDLKAAAAKLPPLLRAYLAMGGWVSDHAVVDNDLDTLHVFTGLEIGRVPKGRARLLRGA
ncbi:GNAT family N-acetyltransferase [Pikeienuella piscinae]|uniref:L-ornithine N(alpha)-acyltransferase n=1 Tax=Pikeienuella piscinae TaxID=2748098 RepID=A0A7L5BZM8_9RHOB|nr:GNAT family N-acetyltransferase [Pikeienuella piscinae]QIE55977.1 GNAT family N-acetyltransferase [Pikeienuella piscinae]